MGFVTDMSLLQVDRLAAVFLSHKHADHMLGLPGILRARSSAAPPLLVSNPLGKAGSCRLFGDGPEMEEEQR